MARFTKGLLVGLLVGIVLAPGTAMAGGGCHNPTIRDAVGTKVEMKSNCFTPAILRTQPGETVTWTNQDNVVHVVIGVGWGARGEPRAGNQEFALADSASRRFDAPGIYAYSCYLHPGMNGVVIVGDVNAQADSSKLQSPTTPNEIVASKLDTVPASNQTKSGIQTSSSTLPIAAFAMTLSGSAGYLLRRRLDRH